MSDALPPEVVEHFERLRRGYLDSLPERAEQLGQFMDRAGDAGWPSAARVELKSRVHKLAGSLGLYGVPQAQVLAESLDQRLEDDDLAVTDLSAELTDLVALMAQRR